MNVRVGEVKTTDQRRIVLVNNVAWDFMLISSNMYARK